MSSFVRISDANGKAIGRYPAEELLFELTRFYRSCEIDMDLTDLNEFYRLVSHGLKSYLPDYEQSLRSGSLEEAWRSLHRLRNVVGSVGAATLDSWMSGLEHELKNGVGQRAIESIPILQANCRILESFLADTVISDSQLTRVNRPRT